MKTKKKRRKGRKLALARARTVAADAPEGGAAFAVDGEDGSIIEPQLLVSRHTRRLLQLALAFVGIPTLLTVIYCGLIATPQYASTAKFAVRFPETMSPIDSLSGITSMPGMSVEVLFSDAYILADFVKSGAMVRTLEQKLPLREIYGSPRIDYLARLAPDASFESLAAYWAKQVSISIDPMSGIISAQAKAFSPKDAQSIATVVVQAADDLINNLSRTAHENAITSSLEEVKAAESRHRDIVVRMQQLRDRMGIADAQESAHGKLKNLGTLEEQLTQTKMALLQRRALSDSSPTVDSLRSRADALAQEIARSRAEIGTEEANASPISARLAAFDELEVERQFASSSLQSAYGALERARSEADRLRRYLAVYLHPTLPQHAAYPTIIWNALLAFLYSALAFGLGTLVYYATSD
jgi:capsular polysaccharide transport system permease protein